MPIPSMLWVYSGGPMDCSFPAANGLQHITLRWVEPNKTAAGQRRFNVRVNNGLPFAVDVFQATGGAKRLLEVTIPVVVTDGAIRVGLRAQLGNVMLSDAVVEPQPATTSGITQWFSCTSPPGASNCAGIQYLELVKNDTAYRYFAVPIDPSFTLTPQWVPGPQASLIGPLDPATGEELRLALVVISVPIDQHTGEWYVRQ